MRRAGKLKLSTIVLTLFLTACGETVIQSLRASIAAANPFVDSLVVSGALSSDSADRLKQDFNDGAACADTLQSDFAAIPSTDPDKRIKKLNAGVKAGRCWKAVVARQNFADNERVQRAANIIDGTFSAVIVFYSLPGEMRASVDGVREVQRDEKELEEDLKKRIKELKEAMKP